MDADEALLMCQLGRFPEAVAHMESAMDKN
jgi:hypothetical protein